MLHLDKIIDKYVGKNRRWIIIMKLENQTKRTLNEVFEQFAPVDEGFVRTSIRILN